jgi:hypothetical protein
MPAWRVCRTGHNQSKAQDVGYAVQLGSIWLHAETLPSETVVWFPRNYVKVRMWHLLASARTIR